VPDDLVSAVRRVLDMHPRPEPDPLTALKARARREMDELFA
jgi:hypothetical protein